jgi:two-component system sensor histidine kinase UhpB
MARAERLQPLAMPPHPARAAPIDALASDAVLLDTLGLAGTVEWHLRQFRKCTGIRYGLAISDVAGFEPPEGQAGTIFYVCCEALSNVARHAGASLVVVELTIARHEVAVTVRDNGIGLAHAAPAARNGGIAAMRARSLAHRGSCEISGTQQSGTAVAVRLPIPQAP